VKDLHGGFDYEAVDAVIRFVELCEEIGVMGREHEIQNEIFSILEDEIPPATRRLRESAPERETLLAAVLRFLELARRFNFNTEHWEDRLA
jgi:hypothetical protein